MMQISAIIMFFLGFLGLITSRNMIKSVICLILKQTSVVVFFLSMNFHEGIRPPIGVNLLENIDYVADPLPQALMITAIIIGLAVTAVNITMFIYLSKKTNSTDWDEVKERAAEILT